uniref:CSRNP_N domain-containing protein n=1 Tax=Anopheles merus TaxID=30066 RepID=A0A182VN26_ANOME
MLKPLKDLLTYLQRNANSSNIFGLTTPTVASTTAAASTAMGPNEAPRMEETIIVSDELSVVEDGGDPLYDPLALDDCPGADVVNVSGTSVGSDADDDGGVGISPDQFTLVDVSTLKPKEQQEADEPETEDDDDEEPATVVVRTVVEEKVMAVEEEQGPIGGLLNGSTSAALVVELETSESSSIVEVGDEVTPAGECERSSPIVLDKFASVEDVIRLSSSASSSPSLLDEAETADGATIQLIDDYVDAVAARETEEGASSQKRPKKGITFEGVTVFYFPRIQGFGCVPSQGGCTLGMEFQHVHSRRLTLSEHSAEQRKVHRQQLQELNPRSSSSEDTSSEEEPSESGSEAESESYGFLQPVSTRQRRALLKAAGVRKIDPSEKDDCREIRTSREVCGCTCRGFCDPHRCACSLAGIKCQVDRPNFPCGCTHEGCANTAGRVEFNPGRVRTHFLHTIMKLRMEGAGEGKAVMEAAGGSSVAGAGGGVSDANAGGGVGGYVIGGEKNWSNGPVRLPPSSMMVGYGTDMPASTVQDMVDGTGSSSSSIEPSSSSTALHANMYYTDSYASFQAQADASTAATHIDPYRHNPLVVGPLHHHVPSSTTVAVSRQHMLTTGHDRPTASTPYVESLRPDGGPPPPTLSLPEKGLVPQVPPQAVNGSVSQTPAAGSTTLPPCSGQATLDQSFRSDSEHCDPNVTVISDTTTLSTIDLDSSGDADNAERLEAINDLLASSRNTLSIVRPSIVAEEDDELRDFKHPPPEPSASAICYEEDDDVDDAGDDDDSDDVILCGGAVRVTRSAKDRDPPPRSLYGTGTLTNGTTTSKAAEQQQLQQKRARCPTVGEECNSSHKRMLQNGSTDEEVRFVSAYTADGVPVTAAAVAVVSSSTANLLAAASVGSLSSAALEPSENLCEIIKNSIVETAVSH